MFFLVWQLFSIYGNILWLACQVNPGTQTEGDKFFPTSSIDTLLCSLKVFEKGIIQRLFWLRKTFEHAKMSSEGKKKSRIQLPSLKKLVHKLVEPSWLNGNSSNIPSRMIRHF